MEVKGDFKTVQPQWVEDDVSSISNVSEPNKERRKRELRSSVGPSTTTASIPKYIGDAIKEESPPSKAILGELIRDISQRGSSSSPPPPLPPKEIDVYPEEDGGEAITSSSTHHQHHHRSSSPKEGGALERTPNRSNSSRQQDTVRRQPHRRASVDTPRIMPSRSRRASIGGTTFYPTSHMAKIDTYLRGSELRLNTDGTCCFLFEEKKFEIETTNETSEFVFYCSLGTLGHWKKVWGKKLLKIMAIWNEEQILKSPKEGYGDVNGNGEEEESEEDETEDNVGLLRIDSSKENGPFVALIYYGHVNKITDATHFQDKLDKFVDDALNYHDKLKAGPEIDEDKDEQKQHQPQSCKSTSTNTTCLTGSLTSSVEEEGANIAYLRLREPAAITASCSSSSSSSSQDDVTPSHHDDQTSCKKSSSGVFTKMIKSLRSKSKEDIARLAFIDPNQKSAFVVDTSTADDLKINVSRQRSSRRQSHHQSRSRSSSRRRAAFTDEPLHSSSHSRKSPTAIDEHRVQSKKGASFHGKDHPRRGPSQKSSSFFHDDYCGGLHYPSKKGSSYHVVDDKRASSSFHRTDRRISSPDDLNESMDARLTRFNQSEPAALSRDIDEVKAAPTSPSKEYRRHQTTDQHRRRRTSSRSRRKVSNNDPPSHGMGRHGAVHHADQSLAGKEKEKSRRRRTLAPPAPPSRPSGIGSTGRSRSARRSKVRAEQKYDK
jgi:hypothetical protein